MTELALAPPARWAGIDLARGLALLSMFVAHFAPAAGPGQVLNLSEYLTAPLFCFLIGFSGEVAHRRHQDRRVDLRGRGGVALEEWVGTCLRAGTLVLVGWLLARTDAQILIVLVHLGVLTLLVALLVRMPTTVVVITAIALGWAVPTSLGSLRVDRAEWLADGRTGWVRLLDFLATGEAYRMTEFTLTACVAILAARAWLRWRPSTSVLALLGLACVTVSAGVLMLDSVRDGDLAPYTGTATVILVDLGLCLGVVALCLAADGWAERRCAPLVWAGRMTLTLYTLQILVAAAWVPAHPTDDSWVLLSAMAAGALLIASGWHLTVRGPMRRGPIEGAVIVVRRAVVAAALRAGSARVVATDR